MKKLVVMMAIAMVTAMAFTTVAVAGTDATNCWLTIKPVVVNGTNGMQITASYPSSWYNLILQESSSLASTNYWRTIQEVEWLVRPVDSSPEVYPYSTTWTVSSMGIDNRFFRIQAQKSAD